MSSQLWAWIVAALAIGGVVVLEFRLRASDADAKASARTAADLKQRLAEAEKRLERREKASRDRGEELAELRRKLDKTKRRALRAQGEQRDEHDRIRELEQELRLARAERRAATEELERLRVAAQREPAKREPSKRRSPEPKAPSSAPPAPPDSEPLNKLRERLAAAEARAVELASEVDKAHKEASRHRRRAAALDTAYTAQRGELEAKKDRLKTQQEELERLRALKVTLSDAVSEPPSSRPSSS